MGTPLDFLNALASIDVVLTAQDSINENEALLVRTNVEQLDKGLRSSGVEFPDYSRASQEYYGKPNGPYQIRKTGAYRAGIYYEAVGETLYYGSRGDTADVAESNPNIGQTALGITTENKIRIVGPALQNTFTNFIRTRNGFK